MKKLYIVLFYAALLLFRSVAYPGFATNLLGLKEKILNGYILRYSSRGYTLLSQMFMIYLNSQADLISNFVTDYQWFEKLSKDGVISGVYVRDGITSFTLGNPFIPEFVAVSQFYIDKDGAIHYVFSDTEKETFVDAIINHRELRYDLEKMSRNLELLLLYDQFMGTYSVLFQRDEGEEIDFESAINTSLSPLVIGFRSVQYAKMLDIENSSFVFVARYGLRFSEFSVELFGLIIIVLLTILLLIFIIHFIFSNLKRGSVKQFPSEKRPKAVDIVGHIDSVVISMKDTAQLSEKKPATPKPVGGSDQLLVHDGIRIKKP